MSVNTTTFVQKQKLDGTWLNSHEQETTNQAKLLLPRAICSSLRCARSWSETGPTTTTQCRVQFIRKDNIRISFVRIVVAMVISTTDLGITD